MTAFVIPKYWKSADPDYYPMAADMEKYRTNLAYFLDVRTPVNMACTSRVVTDPWGGDHPGVWTFIHSRSHLVYRTWTDSQSAILRAFYGWEGADTDPEETDDDLVVSLPVTPDMEVSYFDLSQVPWLVPGALFTVSDVRFVFEVDLT